MDMRCNEHTGCRGPNAVRRIRDNAEFKVEQGFIQATGECISSDVDNMLGPNNSVHVIIQERAYILILGRQDELDEPGVIGEKGIADPVDKIIRAVRLR
jgi:hypothetical protein